MLLIAIKTKRTPLQKERFLDNVVARILSPSNRLCLFEYSVGQFQAGCASWLGNTVDKLLKIKNPDCAVP